MRMILNLFNASGKGRDSRVGTALLGALGLALLLPAGAARAQGATAPSAALVVELKALVAQYGWPANLGRLCATMRLDSAEDCRWKQISVSVGEPGTLDSHGFHVRAAAPEGDMLVFHLKPLVGEFFLVSPTGELRAAFYRSPGADYAQIAVSEARPGFEASMAFWDRSLTSLREEFSKGGGPRR